MKIQSIFFLVISCLILNYGFTQQIVIKNILTPNHKLLYEEKGIKVYMIPLDSTKKIVDGNVVAEIRPCFLMFRPNFCAIPSSDSTKNRKLKINNFDALLINWIENKKDMQSLNLNLWNSTITFSLLGKYNPKYLYAKEMVENSLKSVVIEGYQSPFQFNTILFDENRFGFKLVDNLGIYKYEYHNPYSKDKFIVKFSGITTTEKNVNKKFKDRIKALRATIISENMLIINGFETQEVILKTSFNDFYYLTYYKNKRSYIIVEGISMEQNSLDSFRAMAQSISVFE